MKVLITGASGFIGKNLKLHLLQQEKFEILEFNRDDSVDELPRLVSQADWVVHLAGVNRPVSVEEFYSVNSNLTSALCCAVLEKIEMTGRLTPVIFSSSIQVDADNDYGKSKLLAEYELLKLQKTTDNPVYVYRLPNVFGKWSRPNYNSVVATFCHNIARDLAITINNPESPMQFVYIDDVCFDIINIIENGGVDVNDKRIIHPSTKHATTVGELADIIRKFKSDRNALLLPEAGQGFIRALYSTFISYLPPTEFSYRIPMYGDDRGVFAEMAKTTTSGQFSFFTAKPGITRGGHYHHTKTEKFLVLTGEALFRFRDLSTSEYVEIHVSGAESMVVDTIPGWAHDITNIGTTELVVMLWANEVFDRKKSDTFMSQI